jgi:hypothetical protein
MITKNSVYLFLNACNIHTRTKKKHNRKRARVISLSTSSIVLPFFFSFGLIAIDDEAPPANDEKEAVALGAWEKKQQ